MKKHYLITSDRSPFGRLITAFPQIEVIEQVDGPSDFPEGQGATVWLWSGLSGWIQSLDMIVSHHASVSVVVVSLSPSPAEGMLALRHGAKGYCHAIATPEMLREVDLVLTHGGLWVGAEILGRIIEKVDAIQSVQPVCSAGSLEGLSVRELEVAHIVAEGCSNKQVATRLGITERTVKAHLSAIFEKLKVRDRLQLALKLKS